MLDLDTLARCVARCPGVVAAWLFGSLARGDERADSDLDLAVLMRPGEDLASLRDLSVGLERFSPSGRVDIVVLGQQGPVFRHHVLREGRLLVDEDPRVRHAFEARTHVEYFDWKPTHDIAMASALVGLRRRFGERTA